MAYAAWIASGVHDSDGAGQHRSVEREAIEAQTAGNGFEVAHMRLERVVGHFPLRKAAASVIVTDNRPPFGKLLEAGAKPWQVPHLLQVAEEDRRHQHKRRAGPQSLVGDAHPIAGPGEPNARHHSGLILRVLKSLGRRV